MNVNAVQVIWSGFSGLSAIIFVITLALLWPKRHIPAVGYLWFFLAGTAVRDGVIAILLILAASELLSSNTLLPLLVFFATQLLTSTPALVYAGFVLGIVPGKPINRIFKPPPTELE